MHHDCLWYCIPLRMLITNTYYIMYRNFDILYLYIYFPLWPLIVVDIFRSVINIWNSPCLIFTWWACLLNVWVYGRVCVGECLCASVYEFLYICVLNSNWKLFLSESTTYAACRIVRLIVHRNNRKPLVLHFTRGNHYLVQWNHVQHCFI